MSVEALTERGGGDDVPPVGAQADSRRYITCECQIIAHTPIDILSRLALAHKLAQLAPPLARGQDAAAVALLYLVERQTSGWRRERVHIYLRWSLCFDAARSDVTLQVARARRQLGLAFERVRAGLGAHYAFEPIAGSTIRKRLRLVMGSALRRPEQRAELAYTRLRPCAESLAPVHVQPTLDLLLSQPGHAALQFTLERLAVDVSADVSAAASPLRLGIVALGAAAAPGALRLLARELRGRGALVARAEPLPAPPKLKALRPQSATDRRRFLENVFRPAADPWTQAGQPVDMAISSKEAALLLPLPFVLFD
jgi:hypothetical protein